MNRFSKDLDSVDSLLPEIFLQNLQNSFVIVSIVILCVISVPFIGLIFLPLGVLFYFVQAFFRKTSRELKRLDSVSRTPVYSLFAEMLQGIQTIRAYNREEGTFEKLHARSDDNMKHFFSFWMVFNQVIFCSILIFCL